MDRAEKSAEALREQNLVMVPFLNLLVQLSIFLSMAEQFNLSVLDYEVTQYNATVKTINGAILKG